MQCYPIWRDRFAIVRRAGIVPSKSSHAPPLSLSLSLSLSLRVCVLTLQTQSQREQAPRSGDGMLITGRTSPLLTAFFLFVLTAAALASESDHKYQVDDPITLWVNKVAPYNNPQETYNYYSLPFCQPSRDPAHKPGALGEVLGGNELIDSQIKIKFRRNVDNGFICLLELDAVKVKQFKDAIEGTYWFELFIDDLPLWGFVGLNDYNHYRSESKHYMFSHSYIYIRYNGNQIIHVNYTQASPKLLEAGKTLQLTYSVKWFPTNTTFSQRYDVYLDRPFFEYQIHWFSFFNSFMTVIFLIGVSMILMRKLRKDYAKYAREDNDADILERDVNEESGWKLVHGDVFRPPPNFILLSAVVGTGAQLTMLVLIVSISSIIWKLYIRRGAIVTTSIVCYALTSFISGYVSGSLYLRNGGESWIKTMILTASLFPFTCFGISLVLNTIAMFYGSLAAIPFGTMVLLFVIWAFVSFPLVSIGTIMGRRWCGALNNPCRIKTIPRPIPDEKWYLKPVISLMGGFLPFCGIFIEMYFLFTSSWSYKVYYAYGFMLLLFLTLIIITVGVTIMGTYFLLNAENYHWQWTSFLSAALTAAYAYLYSVYYYYMETGMSGFFQTSFYFGYTLMGCLGIGIICGAAGYIGSSIFVRRIYNNIKCD